jgi:hypothetical protein
MAHGPHAPEMTMDRATFNQSHLPAKSPFLEAILNLHGVPAVEPPHMHGAPAVELRGLGRGSLVRRGSGGGSQAALGSDAAPQRQNLVPLSTSGSPRRRQHLGASNGAAPACGARCPRPQCGTRAHYPARLTAGEGQGRRTCSAPLAGGSGGEVGSAHPPASIGSGCPGGTAVGRFQSWKQLRPRVPSEESHAILPLAASLLALSVEGMAQGGKAALEGALVCDCFRRRKWLFPPAFPRPLVQRRAA